MGPAASDSIRSYQMKRILKYFLQGLLIFVPAGLTIFIIVYVFTSLDKLLRELFQIPFRGLGLLVTIGGIFLIGLFASNFVGKKLFELVDKLFANVPLVKMLYGAISYQGPRGGLCRRKEKIRQARAGNARTRL